MPDAQGNYAGDWAGVLPDNTQNIIHYADQYQRVNQQRALAKAKLVEENKRQQSDYLKQVGENFKQSDYTDQNPYTAGTTKDIADTQQKYYQLLSNATKSGKTIDQGQLLANMADDTKRIKNNYNLAGQKAAEIKDSIKGLDLDPEVKDKLTGLSMDGYFNSTDPTNGQRSINPNNWNKNMTGSDVVKNAMEKYHGILGSNNGVDEAVSNQMHKLDKTKIDTPTEIDAHGNITKVGYKADVNAEQALYDKNGQPIIDTNGKEIPGRIPDHVGIRVQPVVVDGKQITNPDGTPKMTVAKDLEDKYLAEPRVALRVKNELDNAIGTENQTRQAANQQRQTQGLPPLPMITGDSEEAKTMKSDIVLQKLRQNMPPTAINMDEASKLQFENNLKLRSANNASANLDISKQRLKLAQDKATGEGDGTITRDLYAELAHQADHVNPGKTAKSLTTVDASTQTALVDIAKKITGDAKIGQSDLNFKKNKDGAIELWMNADPDPKKKNDETNVPKLLTELRYEDVNGGKVNPSKGERQGMLQKAAEKIKSVFTPKKASSKIAGIGEGSLN